MKIKHFIMLFAAALSFSACAEVPPIKETVPPEQQTVVPAPENGWTARELMASSYIFNTRLEYPLTLKSLGSGFSISAYLSDFDSEDTPEGSRRYYIEHVDSRSFDTLLISPSVFFENDEDGISPDEAVSKLELYTDYWSVNGVKFHTPEEDIERFLGKPDEIARYEDIYVYYIYLDRESGRKLIDVTVSEKNKEVTSVTISM